MLSTMKEMQEKLHNLKGPEVSNVLKLFVDLWEIQKDFSVSKLSK